MLPVYSGAVHSAPEFFYRLSTYPENFFTALGAVLIVGGALVGELKMPKKGIKLTVSARKNLLKS